MKTMFNVGLEFEDFINSDDSKSKSQEEIWISQLEKMDITVIEQNR